MILLVSTTFLDTGAKESDKPAGGAICGSFIVFGGLSVLAYRPWRKYIECKRQRRFLRHTDEVRTESDPENDYRVESRLASDRNKGPKLPTAPKPAPDDVVI